MSDPEEKSKIDEQIENNKAVSDHPIQNTTLSRRSIMKIAGASGVAGLLGSQSPVAASDDENDDHDHYEIEATPENVEWGVFDPDREPILEIESGDAVTIGTVLTSPDEDDHEEFLAENGIDESDMLEEEIVIGNEVKPEGAHVVTGPIYVEDAEPGDVLEIQIQDIEVTAPYGTSYGGPGGALPDTDFSESEKQVVPFDEERETALFSEAVGMDIDQDIEIPLDPFMGVMAVSPDPSRGEIGTIAPSHFGGNMDNRQLGVGTSVYLPVSAEGALFWTGDGHSAQGNGEVSLTAIETSLTPTMKFVLHKDVPLDWPVAESEEYYIPMGFNEDLDYAMEHSVREAISLIVNEHGLEPLDAYRLCSLAVDFNIAQVVDDMEIVHAMIPKSIFEEGGDLSPDSLSTYQFEG